MADLLTGSPPAVIFHQGVFGFFHGEWIPVPTPDVLLFQVMHYVFCIIPLIFWISSLISRRVCEAHFPVQDTKKFIDGRKYKSCTETVVSLSPTYLRLDVLFYIALTIINVKIVYIKAQSLMGSICLLFSPGFAWTIPLAGLVTLARWNAHIPYRVKAE